MQEWAAMRSIWNQKPGSAAGSNAHSLQRTPKVVQDTAPTSSLKPAGHSLIQLQQRYGNRYVQRMLASGMSRVASTILPMVQRGDRDDDGVASSESLSGVVAEWGSLVVKPFRRWYLRRRFAEKYLELKKIAVDDDVRESNFSAHTVSFLLQVRAKLAEEIGDALRELKTSEKDQDEDDNTDDQASDAVEEISVPSPSVTIDEGATANELKKAVVDDEFIRLITAYQQVKRIDDCTPGVIDRKTYDALVASDGVLTYPDLAYAPTPYVNQGSNVDPDLGVLFPTTEIGRYDLLRRIIRRRAGVFFDTPYFVNLVGLRGVKTDGETLTVTGNAVGEWNDAVFVVYKDERWQKHARLFVGTVDPTEMKSPNSKSHTTNFPAEGTHLFEMGTHGGSFKDAADKSYPALVPISAEQELPGYRYECIYPNSKKRRDVKCKAEENWEWRFYLGVEGGAPSQDHVHTTHSKRKPDDAGGKVEKGAGVLKEKVSIMTIDPSRRHATLSFHIGEDQVEISLILPVSKLNALKQVAGSAGTFVDEVTDDGPVYVSTTEEIEVPTGEPFSELGDTGDLWSEGCTVVKGADKWIEFWTLIKQAEGLGQKVFPHTILNAVTLKEEFNAVLQDRLTEYNEMTEQASKCAWGHCDW